MTDYKAEHQESSFKTQRAAILRVLGGAGEKWVPLPQILELRISQYGDRIYELRRLGHRIESKSEWRNGKRLSWFRLVPLPISTRALDKVSAQSSLSASTPDLSETASSFPEFGNLAPERYGD